jgi:hypothetical protein
MTLTLADYFIALVVFSILVSIAIWIASKILP